MPVNGAAKKRSPKPKPRTPVSISMGRSVAASL
jgi:hypothetical protein